MRNWQLPSAFLLAMSLLLAGCRGTLEIGIETPAPTATVEVAELDVTLTPVATAPDPTGAPPTWMAPPTLEPTNTPLPTATPAPTSTSLPPGPKVFSFSASPAEAWAGDTVILRWEARGDRATICPSARYILFSSDDCWQVPISGSAEFTIPPAAASFPRVDFTLAVETADPAAAATGQASVGLRCALTWFFSDEPQAIICPLEPLHTYAAAQRLQQGTMIWLEEPGRYYVLQNAPLYEDAERDKLDLINDPLEITGDTSSEFQAPEGLHAPVSGFGLIWRGDISQSPGFHEQLGWGLAPEFGYDAILQCDNAAPSGGRSWQTCYLKGPDGAVIMLHPLGGWQRWSEP